MADDDQMTRQRYRQQTGDADDAGETSSASRREYAAENNRALEEAKTKRLGRKLNWVILGLTLAIIIVFLILFFTP
ncbi:hypothetical protein [Lactiplantibacillus songbeiensis]|jgi:hypothetical protein|uniref:Uncharacterized protein n=1 Tax=Lactiplantibacillus songbeiensis TaxID=2559920 RepID=A0ABW4BX14_9LACO|nr:hypothetical protein [Lactiplantibacillus songbeiensis]